MDEVDRSILAVLEVDGRISNAELAARVGLSPSPCLRRVRRLEETGVIRGYRALIDPAAVGRGLRGSPASDCCGTAARTWSRSSARWSD
jgi:Lrp/AsnC family transcriptional regulator, leucine-responsive regulatory protein